MPCHLGAKEVVGMACGAFCPSAGSAGCKCPWDRTPPRHPGTLSTDVSVGSQRPGEKEHRPVGCVQWDTGCLGAVAMGEFNRGKRRWQTSNETQKQVSGSPLRWFCLVILREDLGICTVKKLLRKVGCSPRFGNHMGVESRWNMNQSQAAVSPGFTTCPGWSPVTRWLAYSSDLQSWAYAINGMIVCEPLLN